MKALTTLALLVLCTLSPVVFSQKRPLVFLSDFGLKDGAVAAMKGVAYSVSPELSMFDITHEIPPYNIWEAAYRLHQTASYWPAGTVFVCVVDPGVGSERKSIVVKSKAGQYFVTPDNGTLTLISEFTGIAEVRQIDELINRLKNSGTSYTFHGRDVYGYTGARLAAGVITFEQVGKRLPPSVILLPFEKPIIQGDSLKGGIDVLDVQYGNVWSNITAAMLTKFGLEYGEKVHVRILHEGKSVFNQPVLFGKTFSEVPEGEPVAYLNSLLNFSIGINVGDFAKRHQVASGPGWTIILSRPPK